MDWQERYFNNLDQDIDNLQNSVDNSRCEINRTICTSEEHITQLISQALLEIRDKENQRQSKMLSLNDQIHKNYHDLMAEIKTQNKWIIGFIITTMLTIAGICISVMMKLF